MIPRLQQLWWMVGILRHHHHFYHWSICRILDSRGSCSFSIPILISQGPRNETVTDPFDKKNGQRKV